MKTKRNIVKMAFGGEGDDEGGGGTKPARPTSLTPSQLNEFSNFGSGTPANYNKLLDANGLKSAGTLYDPYDIPMNTHGGVVSAHQDWIGATTQKAISNARRLNIPPEDFTDNAALIYGKDRYADTIFNNDTFKKTYPNYLQVAAKIYKDRYNSYVPTPDTVSAPNQAGAAMAVAGPMMSMGGTVDDLNSEEMAQVQQVAEQRGITPQEALQLIQKSQSQGSSDDGDGDEMVMGGPVKPKPKYNFPSAYMFDHLHPEFDPQPSDSTNYNTMFNRALLNKNLDPNSFFNLAHSYTDATKMGEYDAANGLNAARGQYLTNMTYGNAIQDARDQQAGTTPNNGKFAYGGINIKKSHEGRFTAYKKKTGQTTEEATHSKNPHVRAMAVFAKNAAGWNKGAFGMDTTGSTIPELEGGEAVQTPDGKVGEVKGPSHEQGGVDVNLPNGSKVYSDRLGLDGKTMKDRKMEREKRMNSVKKLMNKPYASQLAKNTAQKTMENIQGEEQQDMAMQKAASQIYAPPVQNTGDNNTGGSIQPKKFAYGDDGTGDSDFAAYANGINGLIGPNQPYNVAPPLRGSDFATTPPIGATNPSMMSSTGTINPTAVIPPFNKNSLPIIPEDNNRGFTAGDYVGMAGTLFGSIMPLINTKNNAAATPPNINRFRGYGVNALKDNDTAQDYLASSEGNGLSDIGTGETSAITRNNEDSSSLNTARALNIATNMNADKARARVRANYNGAMANVLGQRSQLDNSKDYREMEGDTQVDTNNKMDIDNFYSSLGANYSNLASGIENIGKDFNTHQSNNDDEDLMGLLTKNGIRIGRGNDGRLKLMNN